MVRGAGQVEAGQLIGRAEAPGGLDVHAPAWGQVVSLTHINTPGENEIPAVLIETARESRLSPESLDLPLPATEPPADLVLKLDDLVSAADQAGLTDFQPSGGNLAEQLRRAAEAEVRHLIVNLLADERAGLMPSWPTNEELTTIVRLTDVIGKGLSASRVWIAADLADTRTLKRLRATARPASVRVAGLVNKYPQHDPVLLTYSLAGLEVPPGQDIVSVGVLVLQAEALLHLAAAIDWPGHQPTPMTHRAVTVAGPAIAQPGRYWIPIGTAFRDILSHVGLIHTPKRVIAGGPLTGRAVAHLDVVTTKQTAGLLVLDQASDRTPVPSPCIRCGWCQEDCPVGLDPRSLLNLAERGEVTQAASHFPQACIECGVCSYVCPAELPLAEAAISLKGAVRASG